MSPEYQITQEDLILIKEALIWFKSMQEEGMMVWSGVSQIQYKQVQEKYKLLDDLLRKLDK